MTYTEILYYTTFACIMICWFVFVAAFLLRKRPQSSGEKKRDNKAFAGIILEAAGYSTVWMLRRTQPL